MAVTERVKAAAPVVDRLLKDRPVQDQLLDAGGAAVVFANRGARAKVTSAIGGTSSSADGAGSSPQPAATPA